jgi:hypothetical protein
MARVAGRKGHESSSAPSRLCGDGCLCDGRGRCDDGGRFIWFGGSRHSLAGAAVLNHLAAHIKANATMQLPGDATLVLRTQSYPDGTSSSEADLYADNGEYFSTPTESGLPAAIADNANVGNGFTAREIKAALDAVNGNLATAAKRWQRRPLTMASNRPNTGADISALKQKIDAQTNLTAAQKAALLQKIVDEANSPSGQQASTDNYIWMDSMDTLIEGAGNPDVRIGVLRILSTLSEVAVSEHDYERSADHHADRERAGASFELSRSDHDQCEHGRRCRASRSFAGGNTWSDVIRVSPSD